MSGKEDGVVRSGDYCLCSKSGDTHAKDCSVAGEKKVLSIGKRRNVVGGSASNFVPNNTKPADAMETDEDSGWHVQEARRIQEAFPDAEQITLQVGFGPSGEAHIGTLAEVMRTVMIAEALRAIDSRPVKVLCFFDDQDGMRKVPSNMPNQEMLQGHLNKPLYLIPDPHGSCKSYAEHNINTLKDALKNYGLYNKVEFVNSSDVYREGVFNDALLTILKKHKEILSVILPTLRDERRATYSPFMPLCPETGCVLARGVEEYCESTIVYRNAHGKLVETPVTDGCCKLQWHVDFGMRWAVFGVNYEIYGKDLAPSVRLAQEVCEIITGSAAKVPLGMMYELFLDERGEKISKSKGNSTLSLETWYRVAPIGSLYYFVYQKPRTAKRLDIKQIPRYVDEFLNACKSDVVDYIPREYRATSTVSFQLLVQLASISHADVSVVLKMLERQGHCVDSSMQTLVNHACCLTQNVLLDNLEFRSLQSQWELDAVTALIEALKQTEEVPEKVQFACYEIGKQYAPSLLEWFRVLYGGLFGADRGPRIGTFFAYVGRDRALAMLSELVARKN